MTLRATLPEKKELAAVAVLALALLAVTRQGAMADGQSFSEYRKHVHTYVNSTGLGNWTFVEKPVFPVLLNESQVLAGQNWSIVCPLRANHSYHVYCYGDWVNNGSEPETDYDVYVYDPLGQLEGYHTEAAGLPEHLGTTVDESFFKPKLSGNYTFVVRNDPRESGGAQEATFMTIEDAQCNAWHRHYVEGTDSSNMPVFNTSWAYEFYTQNQRIEVWVRVPDTLDMYEARLYLMANSEQKKGTLLNDVPLAWEHGLYGNRSDRIGGYNLESQEYRGVAYASCEFHGQDMLINFTSPYKGVSLYHLVFIGETGQGAVDFLVKTEFGKASLRPSVVPFRGYPRNDAVVVYSSNSTDLANATLRFSVDGWRNVTALEMEVMDNRTCRAIIPGQDAGSLVSYKVEARDVFESTLKANGSYWVKYPLTLNISLPRKSVTIGENVTVKGYVTPAAGDLAITIVFSSKNQSSVVASTFENGTFVANARLDALGAWDVQATFSEDNLRYGCLSGILTVKVEEPSIFVKYSLYIGGGLGGAAAIGAVIYVKKFRE